MSASDQHELALDRLSVDVSTLANEPALGTKMKDAILLRGLIIVARILVSILRRLETKEDTCQSSSPSSLL